MPLAWLTNAVHSATRSQDVERAHHKGPERGRRPLAHDRVHARSSLGVSEAHVAERAKCLFCKAEDARIWSATIGRAIWMGEAEACLRTPLDDQSAEVDCCMVDSTESGQGIWCVPAAFCARPNVVQIKEHMVLAGWHCTTLMVATQDLTPSGARTALRGALVATVLPCVPHVQDPGHGVAFLPLLIASLARCA